MEIEDDDKDEAEGESEAFDSFEMSIASLFGLQVKGTDLFFD